VFATAADFHYTRLLGILTIFATVFAVFCRTTVTSWVGTLLICIFRHKTCLPGDDCSMLEPRGQPVKLPIITKHCLANTLKLLRGSNNDRALLITDS